MTDRLETVPPPGVFAPLVDRPRRPSTLVLALPERIRDAIVVLIAAALLPPTLAFLVSPPRALAAPSDEAGRAKTPAESAPPGVPSNLRVASTTTTEIRLSWDDNSSNEESFSIERAAVGSRAFAEIAGVKPNATSYTNSGLQPGDEYQYRVRARNAAGPSAYSNTLSARTTVNWLVLIGVSKYKVWRPLAAPLNDIRELKRILLARYQFDDRHTIELLDEGATLEKIHKLFGELKRDVQNQDSVLLFYSGHGSLDTTTNTGFWIPYDGGLDFGQQWLGDVSVQGFLQNLKARHVLVVADSCFSGNILAASRGGEDRVARSSTERYSREYESRSRTVLTSGNQEPVPDASYGSQSAFAWHLSRSLEDNQQPYIDAEDLYYVVRRGVEGQQPLLGPLKNVGHETGGGYVFMLKGAKGFEVFPSEGGASAGASGADRGAAGNAGITAPAADQTPLVKALIERWAKCYGAIDLGCLGEIYPSNRMQRPPTIKGYEVEIPPESIVVTASEQLATVTCTARITTIGRTRGKTVYHPRFSLEKQGGQWKIVEMRMNG